MKKKKNSKKSAFLKNWLPVFLWASIIFALSSANQVKVSDFFFWDFVIKKIAHVSEYSLLYVLIFKATKGKWATSYLLTTIYAASDELHQHFVPGRTATLLDLGFDASGANIAIYIIWKLKQIRQKRPKK